MWTARVAPVAIAAALLAAGCAGAPPRNTSLDQAPPGHQEIRLRIYGQPDTRNLPAHMAVGAAASLPEPLTDVPCTLGNDKGSWEMLAPGKVIVALSHASLAIECRVAGYARAQVRAPCLTPRARNTAAGAASGLFVANAAAPLIALAPGAGVAVLAVAGLAGAGAAIGAASATGPAAEACDYTPTGELAVYLWPEAAR